MSAGQYGRSSGTGVQRLSKGDMEYNERLAQARKEMPSLFEK
jgi:hypothetical protein